MTGERRKTIRMRVTKIAFVKRGANGKEFAMYKSADGDGEPDTMPVALRKYAPVHDDATYSYDVEQVNKMLCQVNEMLRRAAR